MTMTCKNEITDDGGSARIKWLNRGRKRTQSAVARKYYAARIKNRPMKDPRVSES